MYEKYKMYLLVFTIQESLPHPTDLTDKQWNVLEPLILTSKVGGRPRTVDMREILNAIFYILASSCVAMMPHDLPLANSLLLLPFVTD